jgi:hypothetical protein
MQDINLYKGYEGELELILTEVALNESVIFKLRLLNFHFDEVLSLLPLGLHYEEDTIMGNYLRCEGWHNEKWECKTLQQFIDQLISLDVPSKYQDVYNALKLICKSALENNNRLFIELQ